MPVTTVEAAIAAIARGEFVVVVDDADRENEGDLVMAAERVTPEAIAFMVRHTSGLLCVPMLAERLDDLRLPPMVTANTERHGTAFAVSTDYRPGTSTGISAADRAATIRALADPGTTYADFDRPGHVFPLRYVPGGVLKRPGHTEAAVDLARLAGLEPAAVICELTAENGSTISGASLVAFAERHGMQLISIAELVRYRRRSEKLVRRVARTRMPTRHGEFTAVAFESLLTGVQHLALIRGDLTAGAPLVRVHSECLTGDALGSLRCDCGEQLDVALRRVAAEGTGAVIYLRGHEGRGIGLGDKLRAYELQDAGMDTVEANVELGFPPDRRQYGIAAQILFDLGVSELRLMTNNPAKEAALRAYGLGVVAREPLTIPPRAENVRYLWAKQTKLGHRLDVDACSA